MKTNGLSLPQSSNGIERWKPNPKICVDYPFWTRYNEAGEIVFSVPMDYQNRIPVDESEGAEQYEYSHLLLPGGRNVEVYLWETTNKEWADNQRRWVEADTKRDSRHAVRQTAVAEIKGSGESQTGKKKAVWNNDANLLGDKHGEMPAQMHSPTKGYIGPAREPQVEKFVLDMVEREELKVKMEAKNPQIWIVFSKKFYEGEDVKVLMNDLGLSKPRIYQLLNEGRKILAQHRVED